MGHDDHHQAFLIYYEQTKHELFTYLMYRLNFDKMLSEDLLMDVVLKAYTHFAQYDPTQGSFKSWIFSIARNHLANHWRRRQETVSLEKLEEEGFSPAVSPTGERELETQMNHQSVTRALHLLKDSERELIALRYLHELLPQEISELLQKPEGAVRTALSRALQQFKTIYQKLYPQNL